MGEQGKCLSAPRRLFAVLRMAALPVIALVCAVNAQAATLSISANPLSVSSGASSTLTWSSSGATSCAASGACRASSLSRAA